MDINDLFEGVMKIISQYSDEIVAERMQLQMSQIGPGLESKKKNSEKLGLGEKQNDANFPDQEPE